ncbi:MAG: tetratricopeptide repeat protein [Magnetococcales bacterium]|nr:tetratricopeptide repeat protein [Magnetococcales bacterium]
MSAMPEPDELHRLIGLFSAGRLADAETLARFLTERFPDCAFCWNALGNAILQRGGDGEAEACFHRTLRLQPDFAEAGFQLGNLLLAQERYEEAETALRETIRARPEWAEAHSNLGVALLQRHLPEAAEAAFREALRLKPDGVEALYNLGCLLHREHKRPDEAESAFRQALHAQPDHVAAWVRLGRVLLEQKRTAEAESACREALGIRPGHAEACNLLGLTLMEQRRFPEAEQALREAIRLQPELAETHNNLGLLYQSQGRMAEAETAFREAIRRQPELADACLGLGLFLLRCGRFAEGWPWFEYRSHPGLRHRLVTPPDLPLPPWRGESLAGKRLLVVKEQGFGDMLQFCRFLPALLRQGVAMVRFVCHASLERLCKGLEQEGLSVSTHFPETCEYDYWSLLMSLPAHLPLGNDLMASTIPYLRAAPEDIALWRGLLPEAGFRIGLAWKGNASHGNDVNRSLPGLEVLAPLWRVPGVGFVGLQKGGVEAKTPPQGQPLVDLGNRVRDFADTAAIIAQLDLVICVDTAIAHLSGALGKRCWLMLPCIGIDWRWGEAHTESPWYPGVMRLFRQRQPGDWAEVVEEMRAALAHERSQTVAFAKHQDRQQGDDPAADHHAHADDGGLLGAGRAGDVGRQEIIEIPAHHEADADPVTKQTQHVPPSPRRFTPV